MYLQAGMVNYISIETIEQLFQLHICNEVAIFKRTFEIILTLNIIPNKL